MNKFWGLNIWLSLGICWILVQGGHASLDHRYIKHLNICGFWYLELGQLWSLNQFPLDTKKWQYLFLNQTQNSRLNISYWCFAFGTDYCQEPPREIPPMTKVMRREPDRQRQIRPQGTPWICSSIYPKTKICLSYCFVPFTNSSDINRGLSPTTFLWKKSN